MRKIFSVIVCMIALTGCGDKSPVAPTYDPVGTWQVSMTTAGILGIVTIEIAADNTFQSVGTQSSGTQSVISNTQEGSWTRDGNTVTLTSTICKELDDTLMSLVEVDCDGPTAFSLSQNTMTEIDNSLVFSRQ